MLDIIRAYENYLIKVKQASENTVSSYLRDIRQFSEWLTENGVPELASATQVNIRDYLPDGSDRNRGLRVPPSGWRTPA